METFFLRGDICRTELDLLAATPRAEAAAGAPAQAASSSVPAAPTTPPLSGIARAAGPAEALALAAAPLPPPSALGARTLSEPVTPTLGPAHPALAPPEALVLAPLSPASKAATDDAGHSEGKIMCASASRAFGIFLNTGNQIMTFGLMHPDPLPHIRLLQA